MDEHSDRLSHTDRYASEPGADGALRRADALPGLPLQRPPVGAEALTPGTHDWPRISVIIPTLNEARNIGPVLAELPPDVFEVIVVDGCSEDGTVAAAMSARADCRIVIQEGRGKGEALTLGFTVARGDIVVTLDADGSADPAEIPLFVGALLAGADFTKGSRHLVGGGSADLTRLRALGNRALGAAVNLLFRTRFTDLCYGYNAFWRDCLPALSLDCSGFEIETLMNIRAVKAGLRVCEVPSFERPRVHGLSNLNAASDGWRVLKTIVRERRSGRRAPTVRNRVLRREQSHALAPVDRGAGRPSS